MLGFIECLIILLFYILMVKFTKDSVDTDLDKAVTKRIYPRSFRIFIEDNREEIIVVTSLMWPVYLFYRLGAFCGGLIFNEIKDTEEEVLATWFLNKK